LTWRNRTKHRRPRAAIDLACSTSQQCLFNCRRKDLRNFALKPKRNAKRVIVIRYAAIHNDVWDAALRSLERKRRSRIHGECGAHRHDKVRFLSCFVRPLKSIGIKSLAEADSRRLQKATAVAAWCLAMS